MEQVEYSISQALAELKLLDKRITKEIGSVKVVDVVKGEDKFTVKSNMLIDDFIKRANSNNQSINDLIERRYKINNLIMLSNSTTIVKVNGKEMTVIEAINYKETITYKKLLLDFLRKNQLEARRDLEQGNTSVEGKLQVLLTSQFSNKDSSANADNLKDVIKAFNDKNQYKLVDPLKISDLIDDLDKEIDKFINTIDYILSESNAKTKITID